MKHGKRPTRRQKELLKKRRLDPANWYVIKDTPQALEVLHRDSLKPRIIFKSQEIKPISMGLEATLIIYDELHCYGKE